MAKLLPVGMLAVLLLPGISNALELKNVRPCYGVPLGATRPADAKVIAGDRLFMTYDIEGLKVDAKTGMVKFETKFELLDNNKKQVYEKKTPSEARPDLGGNRMPGDLVINTDPKQPAGKYYVRLTVTDKLSSESKSFEYPYEVVPSTFGFAGVIAPAVGFPGQNYMAGFVLVNMELDKKGQPLVDIMMRVLDESGKTEVSKPVYSSLPKDLPDDVDLVKQNFLPMQFPIYLNRTGTFVVEINAADKRAKKMVQLRYTLIVIDVPGGK